MAYVIKSTEQTRFDIAALTQEWSDYSQAQAGYEKLDADLVARLTWMHVTVFKAELDSLRIMWDQLNGAFVLPTWETMDLHDLDLLWNTVFETVDQEFFERTEEDIAQEAEQGIL
jgi:hypothetical protein